MDRPAPPHIPLQADERTTLDTFLDFYRAALVDRTWGLTHEQLQVGHPPTSLTLSRLIGHMAMVEDFWFRHRFVGEEPNEPWVSLDFETDPDAEMTLAQSWSVEELNRRFSEAVASSRAIAASVESLDQLSALPDRDGEHWNMRWILVHMIEEYARHCGHADLIREAIDGDVLD